MNMSPKLQKEIQEVLIENSKELLKPFWYRTNQREGSNPLTGHCFVATEVAYHVWGKENGFKPHVVSNKKIESDKSKQWTHWFLKNKETGAILDLTADQFDSETLVYCYENGKGAGMLKKDGEISKRGQFVIDKLSRKDVL